MPPAVRRMEDERTGWAILRRRGKLLREVIDVDERTRREYMDPVCGEIFYFLAHSGFTQWERPEIPTMSTEKKLEDMDLDDEVMFAFPGGGLAKIILATGRRAFKRGRLEDVRSSQIVSR